MAVRGFHRLITEWSTDSPELAEALRAIQELGDFTPERHEAEAFLHITQARAAWRHADQIRERQRDQERRDALRSGRGPGLHGTCSSCRVVVGLNQDGTCRVHSPGIASARGRDRCDGSRLPPSAVLADTGHQDP